MAQHTRPTDAGIHEFHIGAFGLSITLAGDCPGTVLNLQRHLLPWFPRVPASAGSRHLLLSIWSGPLPGRFRLERNHSLLHSDVGESSLLLLLQQTVEEEILQHSPDFVAVHSGVVVYDDVAILLPGQSQSGKSTLVRELIARGAEYSSDEFAMIDRCGRIHPWPRALMVRDADSVQHPIPARDLGANVRSVPARAGLILFLRYDRDARFQVSPVNQSGALLGLLRNTPHTLADSPRILQPLTSVVTAAVAHEGVRGDAAQAADGLERMLTRLS
jgi:hypothetical protein